MNRDRTRAYRSLNIGEVALPICIERGEGNTLIDVEGNRYLDFCSGSGVTNAGWGRVEIRDAVRRQLDKLIYCAPWYPTDEAIALSERLLDISPPHLTKCGRATGGADANELIYRAAAQLTGKPVTLSLCRAYHGGTRLTVNMSDAEAFRLPSCPGRPRSYRVGLPEDASCPSGSCNGAACTCEVQAILDNRPDIGLVLCEPIIGSGGVIIPPTGYLKSLRTLCRERGIVFALDEVITGFGRAGHMTLAGYWDLEPDAISFGKGMGGGTVPIGAVVMTEELADAVTEWEDVSPTFAWTPMACAAAVANIDLIRSEGLCERSRALGRELLECTRDLFNVYLPSRTLEVRGMGMMVGIELVNDLESREPAYSLLRRLTISLVRAGLMIKVSWDFRVLIFMPPLNISESELDLALSILEKQLGRHADD